MGRHGSSRHAAWLPRPFPSLRYGMCPLTELLLDPTFLYSLVQIRSTQGRRQSGSGPQSLCSAPKLYKRRTKERFSDPRENPVPPDHPESPWIVRKLLPYSRIYYVLSVTSMVI